MGQYDILDLMKKRRRGWLSKDIARKLKVSSGSTASSLKKLLKGKLITRKKVEANMYKYKINTQKL